MSTRASGAGRKKSVVQIVSKQSTPVQAPLGLLSPVAEEMWIRQSKALSEHGSFEPEHYPMLLLYCNAWHYIVLADNSLSNKAIASSFVLSCEGGSGGEKTNPVFTARNLAFNQFIRAGSLLGLDPLSSLRVPMSNAKDSYNPFDYI